MSGSKEGIAVPGECRGGEGRRTVGFEVIEVEFVGDGIGVDELWLEDVSRSNGNR